MLKDIRLMAIIREVDLDSVNEIAAVLLEEGIDGLEVSLSDPENGFECIRRIQEAFADRKFYLGAGTVTKKGEVDCLVDMGISFILTPGYDDVLVAYALEKKLEVLPGVLTPSEVLCAVNRGITLLKLFPADAFSLSYIKSLKGPFPQTNYIAVGGVNQENITRFFDQGFTGVAVGSNLVPRGATIRDVEEIARKAKIYVEYTRRR